MQGPRQKGASKPTVAPPVTRRGRSGRATPRPAPSKPNVKRCGNGSNGFEDLLDPVLERAYRAASYLTNSQADAEDLVQEAALRAYTRFETFRPGTNFRAWFLRILTNTFYMHHRRERATPVRVSIDQVTDGFRHSGATHPGIAQVDTDPATSLVSKLEVAQVRDAIRALPEEFRTVAVLYFIDDLSYGEIATIVERPVGTVRSRLHRGRQLLRAQLWRMAKDHGLVRTPAVASSHQACE